MAQSDLITTPYVLLFLTNWFHHHHHHKHPGLGHLARSVFRVTVALSIVSSVSQLFSFLVGCIEMILKGFGFVAFFAGVKASSFCIHLSCLVYQSCAFSGDSELCRVSSGWITSPSLSKFGGS
jgi:hypothetical protein